MAHVAGVMQMVAIGKRHGRQFKKAGWRGGLALCRLTFHGCCCHLNVGIGRQRGHCSAGFCLTFPIVLGQAMAEFRGQEGGFFGAEMFYLVRAAIHETFAIHLAVRRQWIRSLWPRFGPDLAMIY